MPLAGPRRLAWHLLQTGPDDDATLEDPATPDRDSGPCCVWRHSRPPTTSTRADECGGPLPTHDTMRVVVRSDRGSEPRIRVHVGQSFVVVARQPGGVTAPAVDDGSSALCPMSRSAAGSVRSIVFLARRPGVADIDAVTANIPRGFLGKLYSMRVLVESH